MVVEGIKLAPEDRAVEIVYRAPGPNVMNNLVAGTLFTAIQHILGGGLLRVIPLHMQGRRQREPGPSSPPRKVYPINRLLLTVVDRVLAASA
jgi:hypothetical protein